MVALGLEAIAADCAVKVYGFDFYERAETGNLVDVEFDVFDKVNLAGFVNNNPDPEGFGEDVF
jgi:hypothetical protein